MNARYCIPATMLILVVSAHASQSILDPTPLQSLTKQADAEIIWSAEMAGIETEQASLSVTAIEVESLTDGEILRGLLVELESAEASDQFFVDADRIRQFMDELAHLEPFTRPNLDELDVQVTHSRINGIARCRPSQHDPQAYCPEVRFFVAGGLALILRTPRQRFEFPGITPGTLLAAVFVAADILSKRDQ